MREKDIEARCKKLAEDMGAKCYKWVSPGCDGVPDRILILPWGEIIFVEFKAPGKKPTAQQQRRHQELRDRGQNVVVIDSVEAFRALLRVRETQRR